MPEENSTRLFLACPIPSDIAMQLNAWTQEALQGQPVKPIPVDQLHITLMYFGEVTESAKQELVGAVQNLKWEKIQARTTVITIGKRRSVAVTLHCDWTDFTRLPLFPANRYPHPPEVVLWARLFERSRAWDPMFKYLAVDDREAKYRVHSQGAPFQPLITLARVERRTEVNLEGLILPELTFQIPPPILLESDLNPLGVVHTALARSQYC